MVINYKRTIILITNNKGYKMKIEQKKIDNELNYLRKTLQLYLDMLNTHGYIKSYSFEQDTKELIRQLKQEI